jgi:hypothetical protein
MLGSVDTMLAAAGGPVDLSQVDRDVRGLEQYKALGLALQTIGGRPPANRTLARIERPQARAAALAGGLRRRLPGSGGLQPGPRGGRCEHGRRRPSSHLAQDWTAETDTEVRRATLRGPGVALQPQLSV